MENETPNETVAESETSKPLPTGKAGSWDRSRPLTPSELQSLKDACKKASEQARGKFKDLA